MYEPRRFINHSQPQTLYIAVFLLYINAALAVFRMLVFGVLGLLGLAVAAAGVGAGYGIANEKKWGYWLGVGVTILMLMPLVVLVAQGQLDDVLRVGLGFIFDIALLALLLHPQSREYQRIWFK